MRGALVGAGVALLIGAAGAAAYYTTGREPMRPTIEPTPSTDGVAVGAAPVAAEPASPPASPTAPPPTVQSPTAPAASETPPAGPRPSFDVVLVKPTGGVVAGRAAPGAEVTLEDAGKPVAKTKADVRGEWVITPEQRLGPGEHQLALSAIAPGDERPSRSAEPVTVTVPPDATAGSGSSSAPARLAPPPAVTAAIAPVATRPPVVTQPPGGDATVKRALSVDAIGYDEAGRVVLSGRAEPGAELRLYLDDRFVGALKATDGAWSETLPDALAPGVYRLRVDEVRGPEGKVVTRVALPFQRAVDAKAGSVDGDVVVVQPGNSLWRIAKRSYGAGPRYVQIFDANRDQIADPDLIYPGQIFELPKR